MVPSGSSSSSFMSSSLGYPPSYANTYASANTSPWTPSNSSSAQTADTSPAPTPLRPLNLGPPGYQATITLFERTANETTVYLGPWDVISADPRRVRWRCSYEGDYLEHFLPSNVPADVFPHTLHARHRPYGDPADMELFLTFREPHRIRYVTANDAVVHDDRIEVKYEFTTCDGSHRFQADVRNKELVDYFDVDVIWSDRDGRTDAFGSVRGIGAIQRLKIWRDRYSTYHYLTFLANRTDRRYREYMVLAFDGDIHNRDDGHRRLRLHVRGRRSSTSDGANHNGGGHGPGRRWGRRGGGGSGAGRGAQQPPAPLPGGATLDIRYLGIQFSRTEDYRRFMQLWAHAHGLDSEFRGVPFPSNVYELPARAELDGLDDSDETTP